MKSTLNPCELKTLAQIRGEGEPAPARSRIEQPMRGLNSFRIFLLAAATAAAAAPKLSAQVPKLDDIQFANVWYEISHLPDKREKLCGRDTELLIARGDKANQLLMSGACTLKDGKSNYWTFTAAPARHHDDGKLHTPALLLFHRAWWIYAFDPAAGYCIIGTPNHKQLWIYSLRPTLSPDALTQATSAATSAGFNTTKLVSTTQTKATKS